jgi:hypothetical protein
MTDTVTLAGLTLVPKPTHIKGSFKTGVDLHELPLSDTPKIKMKGRGTYVLTISGEIQPDETSATTMDELEAACVYTQGGTVTFVANYAEWRNKTYTGVIESVDWDYEAGKPQRIPYTINFIVGTVV